MSIEAVAHTLERTDLPPVDRMVLTVYAYHASRDGEALAWPSNATVAQESGASVSTVKEAKRRLIDAGHLEEAGAHPSGARLFRLSMRNTRPAPGPPAGSRPRPAPGSPPAGSRPSPRPAPGPEQSKEPSENSHLLGDELAGYHHPTLNGEVVGIVERFRLAGKERPALKVNTPAILRALKDFAHLPSLELAALDAAEYLAGPKGARYKDAALFLRRSLERQAKRYPSEGATRGKSNRIKPPPLPAEYAHYENN